ncbi:hypothetical protein JTB14_001072 [Gonioctena quinquepunctata]|nr:hypothetical protein JTB14_001072 [Gonioctena quinquepunctata]
MDIRWPRGFSLSQAMDMLKEDDNLLANVDEIFVEPSDTNVDTDEDSANEDEGGMVCNLNDTLLNRRKFMLVF